MTHAACGRPGRKYVRDYKDRFSVRAAQAEYTHGPSDFLFIYLVSSLSSGWNKCDWRV